MSKNSNAFPKGQPPKFRPRVAPLNNRGLDPHGSTVAQPAPLTAAERDQRKTWNRWTEISGEG